MVKLAAAAGTASIALFDLPPPDMQRLRNLFEEVQSMISPFACRRLLGLDGSFDTVRQEWHGQVARFEGDSEARYAAPYMDHAERISSESPQPRRYGIFALFDGNSAHALFHANLAALPGTMGETLRILWILLAPLYDYEDRSQDEIAKLTSSILNQSLTMSQNGAMRANHLKVHLQNVGDRRFAIALAIALKGVQTKPIVAVRGNWLHFEDVT